MGSLTESSRTVRGAKDERSEIHSRSSALKGFFRVDCDGAARNSGQGIRRGSAKYPMRTLS